MSTRPQAPGPAAHSTRDSRQTIAAEDESGLRRGFGSHRLPTTPREPTWLHCRMGTFALFVGLAALFVYLRHRPLWHTDLWGHLAYGRLIVAQRTIPATEPLLPLCQGVPFVDFSWLSEVIGYAAESWRGVEALQFLYASAVIIGVGLLGLCTLRKTGSAAAAALAAALYAWVDWQQLAIMRPQLAGSACFLGVFLLSAGGALARDGNTLPTGRVGVGPALCRLGQFARVVLDRAGALGGIHFGSRSRFAATHRSFGCGA